jgi:hypothetical protein
MTSAIQFQNLYGFQIASILEKEAKKQSKKNEINYLYNNNNCFVCNRCYKKYKNKLNYDKHCLICELSKENASPLNEADVEVDVDFSSNPQVLDIKINECILIKLVKDLVIKYDKLSNEMSEMKKWISKEKKQINILDWLNNHNPLEFQPMSTFDDYINNFMISEEYIKKIINNNIIDVYLYSIDDLFSNDVQDVSSFTSNPIYTSCIPICCFNQKTNVFYIYTEVSISTSDSHVKDQTILFRWREAENEDLLRIFNKIKNKLITELCKWNEFQQLKNAETNSNQIQYTSAKEKTDEIFNKSILKLMTNISSNNIFQKLKIKLYNKIKSDIKEYVEYDFKFTNKDSY